MDDDGERQSYLYLRTQPQGLMAVPLLPDLQGVVLKEGVGEGHCAALQQQQQEQQQQDYCYCQQQRRVARQYYFQWETCCQKVDAALP
jgi:hypothetical protein